MAQTYFAADKICFTLFSILFYSKKTIYASTLCAFAVNVSRETFTANYLTPILSIKVAVQRIEYPLQIILTVIFNNQPTAAVGILFDADFGA